MEDSCQKVIFAHKNNICIKQKTHNDTMKFPKFSLLATAFLMLLSGSEALAQTPSGVPAKRQPMGGVEDVNKEVNDRTLDSLKFMRSKSVV